MAAGAIRPGERIHVIGIAGSGAAGTAVLLQHSGALVNGCDLDAASPYTPALDAVGIRHVAGHDPGHLTDIDRVAITPALRSLSHHAELAAAEAAGLPVATWQALLGGLMATPGQLGLAVAGTHGKSTTTALLGHLLVSAGLDPTVEVGAYVAAWGSSVRVGAGAPFLVEADEWGDNFLNYHPALAIVSTIEMDHPDYFADGAAVLDSFERFVRGMAPDERVGGRILVCGAGDTGVEALVPRLNGWEGRVVRYGPGGDVAATNTRLTRQGSDFRLFEHSFDMALAGEHNVENATAALVVGRELGVAPGALADGLRSFAGAGRRMELIADTAGVRVYDDYAHHPTEVRATLAAARQLVGDRRLWAVFEPHMYSRTVLLLDEFATAFTDADEVVIVEIFASRDSAEAMRATSAEALADAIERVSAVPAIATGDADDTTAYVADHVREGDVVLVMGAGRSYRVARGIASRLAGEGVPS